MLIDPMMYADELKDVSYEELIIKRDELIRSVMRFEQMEKAGDRSGPEWQNVPGPDVRYQANLEYLSAICSLMKERYNTEYIWGGKKLSDEQDN